MLSRHTLLAALALATAAACGGSGSASNSPPDGGAQSRGDAAVGLDAAPDASPDGDSDAGACAALGATCTAGGDCCSVYCKSGVCACNADGYACKTSTDCCASDCTQGTCGGPRDGAVAARSGVPDTTYGSHGCTTLAYAGNDKNDSRPLAAALDASGTLYVAGDTQTDGIGGSSASASGWLATLNAAGATRTNVALPTTFGSVYAIAVSPVSPAAATLFGDGLVERTDASGTVDSTFSWGASDGGSLGAPQGVAYQTTGALVALQGSSLVRVTSSGALDGTFGAGGSVAITSMTPDAMALDASDRIYVAGSASVGGAVDWVVARYAPGGTLDATFGKGGLVDAGPAPRDTLTGGRNVVRVSSSGSDVYVIGRDDDPNVSYTQLWIVHAAAAGADHHFGLSVPANVGGTSNADPSLVFADAAAQADGKLVVAGDDTGGLFWYLTRVGSAGGVDTAYGTSGWVATRADTPSGGPGSTVYGPRFVSLASNGGAIVVEQRQYVQNLYAEDNAIVCKFTP